ncbi:hypothetical protein H1R20_g7147, partial [Candolleomyces eurysporus]
MPQLIWSLALFIAAPSFLLVIYIKLNDRRLKALPSRIASLSERLTPESVRKRSNEFFSTAPAKEIKSKLPERTGRRYIVVGGGGFLGGWVVQQLLERGEDPANVRVLDLSPSPANRAVSEAIPSGLEYLKIDITDAQAVNDAFDRPWSRNSESTTVFHVAASIRFYEHHPMFLQRSVKVNVEGVRNVLEAAKRIGVDVFVYTSSGSVALKSTRMLLWPWESEPKDFVQAINDDTPLPKEHLDYFSNYAVSKAAGEKLVRETDGELLGDGKRMRTGCIRPGNGVFGPRGDILLEAYLFRKANPTWIWNIMQSFCYVENCALAHLLYERRLIDLMNQAGQRLPDIGGQAFCVADPGPPPTFGDANTLLETLTKGECHFIHLSPTLLFVISKLIESYYIMQHRFVSSPFIPAFLKLLFPAIRGDIINLQPPLFYLTNVHLIFDDSRARLSPEKGGLGYEGVWTTEEGLYRTWKEYDQGNKQPHRGAAPGIGFVGGGGKNGTTTVNAVLRAPTTAAHVVKEGLEVPVTPVEDDDWESTTK